ncbi:hypothetical protein PQQ99_07825 [Paraburkholderia sediminicola]|uniref:hypothetical protein n=1 Tax=Paraburkholderia sediminicola TaxID=458836 RepID=UPI0038B99A6A
MHKEMIATTTSGVTSATGVASSWWLWLVDPNSAHVVTMLTVLLIVSQLIWGWAKFLKGKQS